MMNGFQALRSNFNLLRPYNLVEGLAKAQVHVVRCGRSESVRQGAPLERHNLSVATGTLHLTEG